ncbi:MAG: outer membrane protein assembly factor BamA, partial [Gammaproteobacteria bacterium]|nr:outer membrane protein assembly factor BamA [Gammaproteobacteria bacterium]
DGNQRIEAETVKSYLSIAVGDPFDPALINKSLKSLFATGLFGDINMLREGNTLVVRIVENQIINRIAFEGNERIKDDALSNEVELRSRVVFSRTKVQNDVARIVEIYRRSGRFAATVDAKIIQLPQNRVDLVFEINEGPETDIKRINFIGNRKFSDGDLRDVILTKETSFLNFFSSDDTYDPDRLTFDRDLLRTYYLSQGYADFRVISAIAELTRDRTGFFITFTVDEGRRYKFGAINIDSKLRDLSIDELFTNVETFQDDWYDANLIEDTIQALTDTVGNLGFAFVDIRPRTDRDRDNLIIDLVYEIAEGPRVFVERINISGNVRTLDKVIRREFRLVEGDAFNAAKYRRSRQRIQNLGFFETVNFSQKTGSEPDKTVIEVEVSETSTGQLSFGAGVSSVDGLLANVSINERNLLGRGQNLRLSFLISGRRQQVDLGFTEPYFLGREVSAGFDVFTRDTDLTDRDNFDEDSTGGVLRMGYAITENLRHNVRYRAQRSVLNNFDDDISPLIKAESGKRVTSAIGHTISYDVRNSFFNPSEGYVVRLEQDFAGLGGDASYLKNKISGEFHYPITDFFTGTLTGSVGNIVGLFGENVRIDERFFIGGQSFRGFAVAGIGPRDVRFDDPLGGNTFVISTAEVSFPIGLVTAVDLRGRFFTDVGTLTSIDVSNADVVDGSELRASVGFGVSYGSPFGPILIDVGFPILKEDFDDTEVILFSFGARF